MQIKQKFFAAGASLALASPLLAHAADNFKLVASDGLPGDAFGNAVSVDFQTALAGAPGSDTLGIDAGAAYVFSFDGVAWNEINKLVASNGAAGDGFGSAVAVDGDTIVVGAPGSNATIALGGAAYVFRFDGTNWNEEAILVPVGLPASAALGFSVSLSGDTAVLGAKGASTAYVFTRSGISWTLEAALTPSIAQVGDEFGNSVAVVNHHIAVGAPAADGAATATGAVYTYFREGTFWTQSARVIRTNGAGATGDRYGHAVGLFLAATGMELLVGAPLRNGSGPESGEIQLFGRTVGTWTLIMEKTGISPGDQNGTSVAKSYRGTLSGCPFDDDEADNGGTAFRYMDVFGAAFPLEVPVAHDNEMDDHFGTSVSSSNPWHFIGAPGNDENGLDAGAAYVHSLVQARDFPLNGSGVNPLVLTSQAPPVIGQPWNFDVDLTNFPTSEMTYLVLKTLPLDPPLTLPKGELLISTVVPTILSSQTSTGSHTLMVPNNPVFAGLSVTAQVFILGAGPTFPTLAFGDAVMSIVGTSNLPQNMEL